MIFFSCNLKQINNHKFLVLALRAPAIFLAFEKFTCAYLFQIALEII